MADLGIEFGGGPISVPAVISRGGVVGGVFRPDFEGGGGG